MRYSCNLVLHTTNPRPRDAIRRQERIHSKIQSRTWSNAKHRPVLTPAPETIPPTRPSCHNAVVVQTEEQDRSHEVRPSGLFGGGDPVVCRSCRCTGDTRALALLEAGARREALMRMFENNSVSENGGPESVEMIEWRNERWQWERVVCVAGGNARATSAGLFEGSSSSRVTGMDMEWMLRVLMMLRRQLVGSPCWLRRNGMRCHAPTVMVAPSLWRFLILWPNEMIAMIHQM